MKEERERKRDRRIKRGGWRESACKCIQVLLVYVHVYTTLYTCIQYTYSHRYITCTYLHSCVFLPFSQLFSKPCYSVLQLSPYYRSLFSFPLPLCQLAPK